MSKKAKSETINQKARVRDDSDYQSALQKLKSTNLSVIIEVLEKFIGDISSANEFSLPERRDALRRLLAAILKSADHLKPESADKPSWQDRDPKKMQTPFDFLMETYSEEIADGSLAKSTIRAKDYSLYKALGNPHWIKKVGTENVFSKLPTKKKYSDMSIELLPEGITRTAIIKLLPAEFREMFRLIRVVEMRRHRTK